VEAAVVAVILGKICNHKTEKQEEEDKRVFQDKKNKEEELLRGYLCLNSASK